MQYVVLIVGLAALAACNKTSVQDPFASDLSNLTFMLPEGAGTLNTGYTVNFSRFGQSQSNANCSPDKSWTNAITSREVVVSHEVKNGCDYLIVLELGKVNSAKNGLDAVYYTNVNTEPGTPVRSDQLKGGEVEVVIKLYKTPNAPADAPGVLQTQKYTNLKINVSFDTSGSLNSQGNQGAGGMGLTDYEKVLQEVKLVNHANQDAGTVFDKVNGKEHFLVKFSWVNCGPCDTLNKELAKDEVYNQIKQSGKCPILTVVLGEGELLERKYSPTSDFYKNPASVGSGLKTQFSNGFPYAALINRKTGVVKEGGGGVYSPAISEFKNRCQ